MTTRGSHAKTRVADWREVAPLLAWSLMLGSLLGVAVETAYRFAVFGVVENRTGLVVGWLSPIYGVGAVALTGVALATDGRLTQFFAAFFAGGAIETLASLWMERAFHVSAWNYSGEFLSLAGRTDITHCVFWGALGVVWAGSAVPALRRLVRAASAHDGAHVTLTKATALLLTLFALDSALTVAALDRWDARARGEDARDWAAQTIDETFDDAWMSSHFETMGRIESSREAAVETSSTAGEGATGRHDDTMALTLNERSKDGDTEA